LNEEHQKACCKPLWKAKATAKFGII